MLDRYRYLRSTHIHGFVGGDRTKLIERLGKLYHEGGYLNRPSQQWEMLGGRYRPTVYENSAKAIDLLQSQGLVEQCGEISGSRDCAGETRQFAHALMICDVLASLELAAMATPGVRFIPWAEIRAKAPVATRASAGAPQIPVSVSCTFTGSSRTEQADVLLTPDAVFGLEYSGTGTKSYRFFALEADRGTMPVSRTNLRQSSYLKKILCYRQVTAERLHKAHWGTPNLFVLNVMASEQHMQNVMQLLEQITGGAGSTVFLFSVLNTTKGGHSVRGQDQLSLSERLERVNHTSLDIFRL